MVGNYKRSYLLSTSPHPRFSDEVGQSTAIVLALILALILVVGAVQVFAISQIPLSAQAINSEQALAAAQSGIVNYIDHVNENTSYDTTYCSNNNGSWSNNGSTITPCITDPNDPGFVQAFGTSGWDAVSSPSTTNEKYQYMVNNSNYSATKTVTVWSRGCAGTGNAQSCRLLKAIIKPALAGATITTPPGSQTCSTTSSSTSVCGVTPPSPFYQPRGAPSGTGFTNGIVEYVPTNVSSLDITIHGDYGGAGYCGHSGTTAGNGGPGGEVSFKVPVVSPGDLYPTTGQVSPGDLILGVSGNFGQPAPNGTSGGAGGSETGFIQGGGTNGYGGSGGPGSGGGGGATELIDVNPNTGASNSPNWQILAVAGGGGGGGACGSGVGNNGGTGGNGAASGSNGHPGNGPNGHAGGGTNNTQCYLNLNQAVGSNCQDSLQGPNNGGGGGGGGGLAAGSAGNQGNVNGSGGGAGGQSYVAAGVSDVQFSTTMTAGNQISITASTSAVPNSEMIFTSGSGGTGSQGGWNVGGPNTEPTPLIGATLAGASGGASIGSGGSSGSAGFGNLGGNGTLVNVTGVSDASWSVMVPGQGVSGDAGNNPSGGGNGVNGLNSFGQSGGNGGSSNSNQGPGGGGGGMAGIYNNSAGSLLAQAAGGGGAGGGDSGGNGGVGGQSATSADGNGGNGSCSNGGGNGGSGNNSTDQGGQGANAGPASGGGGGGGGGGNGGDKAAGSTSCPSSGGGGSGGGASGESYGAGTATFSINPFGGAGYVILIFAPPSNENTYSASVPSAETCSASTLCPSQPGVTPPPASALNAQGDAPGGGPSITLVSNSSDAVLVPSSASAVTVDLVGGHGGAGAGSTTGSSCPYSNPGAPGGPGGVTALTLPIAQPGSVGLSGGGTLGPPSTNGQDSAEILPGDWLYIAVGQAGGNASGSLGGKQGNVNGLTQGIPGTGPYPLDYGAGNVGAGTPYGTGNVGGAGAQGGSGSNGAGGGGGGGGASGLWLFQPNNGMWSLLAVAAGGGGGGGGCGWNNSFPTVSGGSGGGNGGTGAGPGSTGSPGNGTGAGGESGDGNKGAMGSMWCTQNGDYSNANNSVCMQNNTELASGNANLGNPPTENLPHIRNGLNGGGGGGGGAGGIGTWNNGAATSINSDNNGQGGGSGTNGGNNSGGNNSGQNSGEDGGGGGSGGGGNMSYVTPGALPPVTTALTGLPTTMPVVPGTTYGASFYQAPASFTDGAIGFSWSTSALASTSLRPEVPQFPTNGSQSWNLPGPTSAAASLTTLEALVVGASGGSTGGPGTTLQECGVLGGSGAQLTIALGTSGLKGGMSGVGDSMTVFPASQGQPSAASPVNGATGNNGYGDNGNQGKYGNGDQFNNNANGGNGGGSSGADQTSNMPGNSPGGGGGGASGLNANNSSGSQTATLAAGGGGAGGGDVGGSEGGASSTSNCTNATSPSAYGGFSGTAAAGSYGGAGGIASYLGTLGWFVGATGAPGGGNTQPGAGGAADNGANGANGGGGGGPQCAGGNGQDGGGGNNNYGAGGGGGGGGCTGPSNNNGGGNGGNGSAVSGTATSACAGSGALNGPCGGGAGGGASGNSYCQVAGSTCGSALELSMSPSELVCQNSNALPGAVPPCISDGYVILLGFPAITNQNVPPTGTTTTLPSSATSTLAVSQLPPTTPPS